MTREWKPGDVALDGGGQRWFAVKASSIQAICWYSETGNAVGGSGTSLRPLAVIDPEDREQVGTLCMRAHDVDRTQAALRSLITPPKPDEPTGLGAVVEDGAGRRWVRTTAESAPVVPWKPVDAPGSWECWSDLPAVRVLSEGVPS